MRNSVLYLIAVVLLTFSCNEYNATLVIIKPLQFKINGNISELQDQLKQRNVVLVYENSYEGDERGVKLFYFDDENYGLHYYFRVYTINNKIKGIEGVISSNDLSRNELYISVESEILPSFKSSVRSLVDAVIRIERGVVKDSLGIYNIEVKTKDILEKIQ